MTLQSTMENGQYGLQTVQRIHQNVVLGGDTIQSLKNALQNWNI